MPVKTKFELKMGVATREAFGQALAAEADAGRGQADRHDEGRGQPWTQAS